MRKGLSVPRLNSAEQYEKPRRELAEKEVDGWYKEGILKLKVARFPWGAELTVVTNRGSRVLEVKHSEKLSKLLDFIEELRECGSVETDYDWVRLERTH